LTDELVGELTGETITAARARELGLVNAVVAPDDVLAYVEKRAPVWRGR
jgi:enoyl-CoA hydratase/carnithine racemase